MISGLRRTLEQGGQRSSTVLSQEALNSFSAAAARPPARSGGPGGPGGPESFGDSSPFRSTAPALQKEYARLVSTSLDPPLEAPGPLSDPMPGPTQERSTKEALELHEAGHAEAELAGSLAGGLSDGLDTPGYNPGYTPGGQAFGANGAHHGSGSEAASTPRAPFGRPSESASLSESDTSSDASSDSWGNFPLGSAKAQFFDCFIVAQAQEELILVDQHAAHERLVYERFKKFSLKRTFRGRNY